MSAARKMSKTAVDDFRRAERAARYLRSRIKAAPKLALVLGSGLGSFADDLSPAVRIPFADIPGFPRSTAQGHAGQLVVGKIDGVAIAAMQGRVHLYEGHSVRDVTFPMRIFHRLGIQAVILTNAAGGIGAHLKQGCLVLLTDHINLQAQNPCLGANEERFGPRFFDMSNAYDPRFRALAAAQARRLGIELLTGVYASVPGPSYETPAEIRYLRTIGADLVGMSTVPEVIAARHMGMRVLALSCVTNMAAGISTQPITHQEVLDTGARVRAHFVALLRAVIPSIAGELRP